jgi:hypothetical protein
VAVVVEGVALPLVHTAWLTAACFTLANALLLTVRIRVENTALGYTWPAPATMQSAAMRWGHLPLAGESGAITPAGDDAERRDDGGAAQ